MTLGTLIETHGAAVLARWPSLMLQADRVHRLIDRYHEAGIIAVRFADGLRIAGPVLIGMTPIRGLRFAGLNALGAVLWAGLIGAIGWMFGDAAEAVFTEIRHVEGWLLLGLAMAGAMVWWLRKRWRH